jgi:putative FmdB family regulatory protein
MPVYEYRCVRCERCFETLGTIATRDAEVSCPSCGQADARRLISTFASISPDGAGVDAGGGCCGGSGGGCACRG